MWEKKSKGTNQCEKKTVTCDVGAAQCKNRTIKCEKRTITCDIETVQYENGTVKCEKKK